MKSGVLLVGNFLSQKRGSRGVCEDLAAKLAQNGRSVITTSNRENRVLRMLDMIQTTWRYRGKYSVAQIDVYSGAGFVWAEVVSWLLRALSKPFILTLHGGNLPEYATKHKNRVLNLLGSATVVTTPSRYLLETMQPYCATIQLLPNPLDLGQYIPRQNATNTRPKLVWLRAFHDLYNPDLAVKTVAELHSSYPDLELTMVGPDKGDGSFQRCQNLASEFGISDRVHFIGGVPKTEVPSWLVKGDIFINTTNVDNTPVSVLEAMVCGLCVVSTNVGGIPYLLDHDQDSLLVPPNEPEAMAKAIRRILTDPALAERLSRNARAKAEQFDWAVILPQWESLLTEVVGRNKHG